MCSDLFPEIQPFDSGMLQVSPLHQLYYEQVGNPKGQPVIYLHGGPGGGISPEVRRFFDPDFYHVILFDQRGAGRSKPHAELRENTSFDIVEDIEKLRRYLDIKRWVVFGGSWGSTLGLLYSIVHPESVEQLMLRGIFLGTQAEMNWLFEKGGASKFYPEYWEKFEAPVPDGQRDRMIKAYYQIFTGDESSRQEQAAIAWSQWEMSISKLLPDFDLIDSYNSPYLAMPIAKIECHFFVNRCFLNNEDFILRNAYRIEHIPCHIIQGRYDVVCQTGNAWTLHKYLPHSVLEIIPDGGHASMDPPIAKALVRMTENYKLRQTNNSKA